MAGGKMKVMNFLEVPQEPAKLEGAYNVRVRWLISEKDGAKNFFMRRFEIDGWTPYHTHPYEHEVLILSGEGVLIGDGIEHRLTEGVFCWIPPNEPHQFKNTGRGSLCILCLIPSQNER